MISSSGLQAVFSHDLVNPTEVWSLQIQGKLKIQMIEKFELQKHHQRLVVEPTPLKNMLKVNMGIIFPNFF